MQGLQLVCAFEGGRDAWRLLMGLHVCSWLTFGTASRPGTSTCSCCCCCSSGPAPDNSSVSAACCTSALAHPNRAGTRGSDTFAGCWCTSCRRARQLLLPVAAPASRLPSRSTHSDSSSSAASSSCWLAGASVCAAVTGRGTAACETTTAPLPQRCKARECTRQQCCHLHPTPTHSSQRT